MNTVFDIGDPNRIQKRIVYILHKSDTPHWMSKDGAGKIVWHHGSGFSTLVTPT
jgi:hypothetical protein